MVIYTDNLYIIGYNLFFINKIKVKLVSKFKTFDYRFIVYYLSMKLFLESNTITITRIIYINPFVNMHQIFYCNFIFILKIKSLYLTPILKIIS